MRGVVEKVRLWMGVGIALLVEVAAPRIPGAERVLVVLVLALAEVVEGEAEGAEGAEAVELKSEDRRGREQCAMIRVW